MVILKVTSAGVQLCAHKFLVWCLSMQNGLSDSDGSKTKSHSKVGHFTLKQTPTFVGVLVVAVVVEVLVVAVVVIAHFKVVHLRERVGSSIRNAVL